jgi:hypothetical protein
MKTFLLSALAALALPYAAGQPASPELRYQPPPNFSRSAIAPPEDFSSNEFNAGIQVYPFRPFAGDIEQAFRRGLLREWIDPRWQEVNVATPPEFRPFTVPPGARLALGVRFAENVAGVARQRMRVLIVAGDAAALLDASANNMATWQRALPALNALAATLRVEAGVPPAPVGAVAAAEGRAVSGLYMGTKSKYVVNLNRPVGSGSQVMALHYYLFSDDGRVYRAYDDIAVPGGEISRFDFEAARRADPVNSGRYTIQGDLMRIQMGQDETIVTGKPQGGRVSINTVQYVRQ